MMWLVRGHYQGPSRLRPTEEESTTKVCETEDEADTMLRWYPGGSKTQAEEHMSEDSGGSSYLCTCTGIDTTRHLDYCMLLNLYRPVESG